MQGMEMCSTQQPPPLPYKDYPMPGGEPFFDDENEYTPCEGQQSGQQQYKQEGGYKERQDFRLTQKRTQQQFFEGTQYNSLQQPYQFYDQTSVMPTYYDQMYQNQYDQGFEFGQSSSFTQFDGYKQPQMSPGRQAAVSPVYQGSVRRYRQY